MEHQAGNAIADTMELTVSAETSGSEYGQIRINNDVVAIIAHETAKKVPGVVELQGTTSDGIAGIIGRKDKAIRIGKENEELLTIDLTVVLEFGVKIPEICVQLQSAVKEAVEEMTGQKVYAVNVVVQGIRSAADKKNEE
ncbi:Asp23/Gls24 family envelope stress response protein [Pontiellaceae bacterium B1224]|nr:Asp23/Gls24 family envelope stress response protein [Pontiellaceae bacterium B1224]